jgi:hypothetical protein
MPAYKVPGYSVVTGPLPGTAEWVRQAVKWSNGALWDNGTYALRNVRGTGDAHTRGVISNHARGVAMDLSYRYIPARKSGVSNGRIKALTFINVVLGNWDALGVQCVLDYYPADHGRGWRVDRVDTMPAKAHNHQAWVRYQQPTIHGAPGGDWFHVEITLGMANDATRVSKAFDAVFGQSTTASQADARVVAQPMKGGKRRAGIRPAT